MEQQPPPVYVICPGPRLPPRRARSRRTRRCSSRSRASPSTAGSRSAHLKGTLEHFARALFGARPRDPAALALLPVHRAERRARRLLLPVRRRGLPRVHGRGLDRDPRRGHGRPERLRLRRGLRPGGRVAAGPSAWASSASRCSSTASRTSRRFYDNDVRFLEQFRGGRAMKVPAAAGWPTTSAELPPLDELAARLSLAGDKVEGVERRGPARERRRRGADRRRARASRPASTRTPTGCSSCRVDVGEARAAPDRVRRLELRRRRHGRRGAARARCCSDGREHRALASCAARPRTA